MKTTIETVTPQQAAKWLEPKHNHDNRALRRGNVEFLSQQILDGKWQTTHQGLAFSKGGRLIDGQHRLAAIVRSGKAVQMMVSVGLDDEVFRVTDCGVIRTHFDRLHLVDDPAQNRVITTTINTYLRATSHRGAAMPVSKIEDAFLAHDGKIADSWLWIGNTWKVREKLGRAGVLASLAVYHYVNQERAIEFCDGYKTGANLPLSSPILALHRAVINNPSRVDYWVAQQAMRQHLRNNTTNVRSVLSATTEDMLGQKNSNRVLKASSERSVRGAATRAKNRAAARV